MDMTPGTDSSYENTLARLENVERRLNEVIEAIARIQALQDRLDSVEEKLVAIEHRVDQFIGVDSQAKSEQPVPKKFLYPTTSEDNPPMSGWRL